MRVKLFYRLLAATLACSAGEQAKTMNFIFSASGESQIWQWASVKGISLRSLRFCRGSQFSCG